MGRRGGLQGEIGAVWGPVGVRVQAGTLARVCTARARLQPLGRAERPRRGGPEL